MLVLARVRGHLVRLPGLAEPTASAGNVLDRHHAVLQHAEGPCEIELPPCPSLHLMVRGTVHVETATASLALPEGAAIGRVRHESLRLGLPPGESASLLHLFPSASWLNAARPGLLPMLHEADSSTARALNAIAAASLALEPPGALCGDDCNYLMNELGAAGNEYRPLIARAPGKSAHHRLDAFLRVARARSLLLHGLERGHTTDSLAAAANLSPCHFIRTFKRVFGVPPHRYMLDHQMRLAYRLLRDGGVTVQQAMYAVGLENYCTFARLFRKAHGQTASAVRDAAHAPGMRGERPRSRIIDGAPGHLFGPGNL